MEKRNWAAWETQEKIQRLVWVIYLLLGLARVSWLTCAVGEVGIAVNVYLLHRNGREARLTCWIGIVLFAVIMAGNIIFALTH